MCSSEFIAAESTLIAAEQSLSTGRSQATSVNDAHHSLPETFGRFEVRALQGQGSFGTVYRAFDSQLQREVALKIPKMQDGESSQDIERFFREARAAASVRHPNICPVYDVGRIDGQFFIAMAYIEGPTLADLIRRANGPMSPNRAALLVRKLATALEAAHRKGVIHRDLKPSNILIDAESGDPVITDFGLARRMALTDAKLTQSGQIMGSPAYMPPEQARAEHELIGPVSDVYSLGVILYELLTGHCPFRGSVAAVLGQVVHDEPQRPSELVASLPPDLETICLKAMSKDVGRRYASMQEFADALNRFRSDPPSPRRSMLQRLTRTRPALTVASVLLLVSVPAALIVFFSSRSDDSTLKLVSHSNAASENRTDHETTPADQDSDPVSQAEDVSPPVAETGPLPPGAHVYPGAPLRSDRIASLPNYNYAIVGDDDWVIWHNDDPEAAQAGAKGKLVYVNFNRTDSANAQYNENHPDGPRKQSIKLGYLTPGAHSFGDGSLQAIRCPVNEFRIREYQREIGMEETQHHDVESSFVLIALDDYVLMFVQGENGYTYLNVAPQVDEGEHRALVFEHLNDFRNFLSTKGILQQLEDNRARLEANVRGVGSAKKTTRDGKKYFAVSYAKVDDELKAVAALRNDLSPLIPPRVVTRADVVADDTRNIRNDDTASPPQPEWRELLGEVDLTEDRIAGTWTRTADGLHLRPQGFSRVAIPFIPTGSYELEAELTRLSGHSEVNIIFPAGPTSCMLSISRNGSWIAFQHVNAREHGLSSAYRFQNNTRHTVTLRVSVRETTADIIAELDGRELHRWSGPLASLSLREVWRIHGNSLGLGAHADEVVFHAVRVRLQSGDLLPVRRPQKTTRIDPDDEIDALSLVNLDDHRVYGTWARHDTGLATTAGGFSRVAIPIVPEGSYQFTFTCAQAGQSHELTAILPVGRTACLLYLGRNGDECGLEHLSGSSIKADRKIPFRRGSSRRVRISVTTEGEDAAIVVHVDRQQVLNWKGPQSAINMREDWRLHPSSLGLGSHDGQVIFHSATFRDSTGSSYLLQ